MALAVILSENTIVSVEHTASPYTAASKADQSRNLTGRTFVPVDRNNIGAEYSIYELDRDDVSILRDVDRYIDPKYVGYVLGNCKHVASFIAAR